MKQVYTQTRRPPVTSLSAVFSAGLIIHERWLLLIITSKISLCGNETCRFRDCRTVHRQKWLLEFATIPIQDLHQGTLESKARCLWLMAKSPRPTKQESSTPPRGPLPDRPSRGSCPLPHQWLTGRWAHDLWTQPVV